MKFDSRFKPWLVTASDDVHYQIARAWLDGNYIVATDAHAMVVLPIESRSSRDSDGPIPTEALKNAVSVAWAANADLAEVLCLKTKVKVAHGRDFERPQDVVLPNWRRVMDVFRLRACRERIHLDVTLLANAAVAMGETEKTQPLALDIYADNTQVLVRPNGQDSARGPVGVVMPMRLVEELPSLPDDLFSEKLRERSK